MISHVFRPILHRFSTDFPTDSPYIDSALREGEEGMSLTERRWNEVSNLREVLARSGCDVPEPLVPRTHLPLGCVVVRYRHLRQAVWGSEPVTAAWKKGLRRELSSDLFR